MYRGFLGGWPLEGASAHLLLHRTILGWTTVKSAKLHILREFTVMCTGRPLAAARSSMAFQNITPGEGLQVQKKAGSPFAIRVGCCLGRGDTFC